MTPTPPRKPGRPRLDAAAPSVSVSVRLSTKQYDELYTRAQHARCSVADIIRAELHGRVVEPRR